ncbi:MAG: hypothetical protein Q9195_007484 [Heterodermia aff. obscurata]
MHYQRDHKCTNSFLCKLLAGQDVKLGTLQHYEAVNTIFESFFAASVESAVTVRTIFYCLLTNPAVYSKLVQEIRGGAVPAGEKAAPVSNNALKNPYLTAVIKESLRLYTSNCPPMERVVPHEGLHANGHFIPKGTVVSVAHYVTHRDRRVFGDDAEIFRPERWLEADPSALKRMEHNFMAFGKGNRLCVGRELGMLELRMFVVEVLAVFDAEWPAEKQPVDIKMYWIMEMFNMNVLFKEVAAASPTA